MDKIDRQIMEILDSIKRNSLLAAKSVLNIDDVATLTGLSKSYIYSLTAKNQIPFYKPNGKLIFFEKEEIENWMRQNKIIVEKSN